MRAPELLPALQIESLEQNGYGVARHAGQVCFVEGALPGEVVDVAVVKRRRSHLFGEARHWHRRSMERISPFCQHFALCGGCRWQYLAYPDQLRYKRQFVCDQFLPALGELCAITEHDIPSPLASPRQRYYRNKLEFSFTASRWLTAAEIAERTPLERRAIGFHKRGRFNRIVEIEHCWLQTSPSNKIRRFIAEWARLHNYSFYDWQRQSGALRSLIIRTASSGQLMVMVVFGEHAESQRPALLNALQEHFPEITSLYWVINDSPNDSIVRYPAFHFSGTKTIVEYCQSLQLHIHPKSFFQTNSAQLAQLCACMLKMVALQGDEVVYDLYCGIGTLALILAAHCRLVWGIEVVQEAVENATFNARINGISNVKFQCADVVEALARSSTRPTPNLIVVDPPRAGLGSKVCDMLLELSAPRILYISCNPATQARDIVQLAVQYCVVQIQPIDMFPHTTHIENMVLLSRRRPSTH